MARRAWAQFTVGCGRGKKAAYLKIKIAIQLMAAAFESSFIRSHGGDELLVNAMMEAGEHNYIILGK